jgi:hypothetical protein
MTLLTLDNALSQQIQTARAGQTDLSLAAPAADLMPSAKLSGSCLSSATHAPSAAAVGASCCEISRNCC